MRQKIGPKHQALLEELNLCEGQVFTLAENVIFLREEFPEVVEEGEFLIFLRASPHSEEFLLLHFLYNGVPMRVSSMIPDDFDSKKVWDCTRLEALQAAALTDFAGLYNQSELVN